MDMFGLLSYIEDHRDSSKERMNSKNLQKYWDECKRKFFVFNLIKILENEGDHELFSRLKEKYKTFDEDVMKILEQDALVDVVCGLEGKYENFCKITNDNLCNTVGMPFDGFLLRNWKKGGCALFSLKALIEHYTRKVLDVKKYAAGTWSNLTHFMTPSGIKKVLSENDVQFSEKTVRDLSYKESLNRLRNNLDEGPILLLVGNGFLSDGNFSLKRALRHLHYITLRGYDRNNFYIYNSNLEKKFKNGLMVFNYRTIIESWLIMGGYAIAVKGIESW